MDDKTILSRISGLVGDEHRLRERHLRGELTDAEEHERLRRLEESLDQCWDLLRQRRARQEAGLDPTRARPRATGEVEGYLQ